MKKIILLAFIISFGVAGFAQAQKRYSYLTIWFEKKIDRDADHYYYIMNAELGNGLAPEVYDLLIYRSERDLKNKDVDFYHKQNDSVKTYFNYFTNPTAGLEYLGKKGWELVSVANEVSSGVDKVWMSGDFHPVTAITATQKYYFKKERD